MLIFYKGTILCFTRYNHVNNCIDSIQLIAKNNLYLLNKISFGFGLISSFGMTLVGNFQVKFLQNIEFRLHILN